MLALKIIFKILLYCMILLIVRKVTNIKQKNELAQDELCKEYIDWKVLSIIYMVIGMIFGIITILIVSFPADLNKHTQWIIAWCFGLVTLLFLILSILYGRIYVKFGKEKIYWREKNGKVCEMKYADITYYQIEENSIGIYQDEQCILKFPIGNRYSIIKILNKNKVKKRKYNDGILVMKEDNFYLIVYLIFFICGMLLLLGCIYYGMILGVLMFFACTVIMGKYFWSALTRRIIINDKIICESTKFRKKEISFKEVDYLSLKKAENEVFVYIHSKDGKVIKISKHYTNFDLFESLISKKNWRRK